MSMRISATVAYLASSRVIAGVIVVLPLYSLAVLMSFLAARSGPQPRQAIASKLDIITSTLSSIRWTWCVLPDCCCYGYRHHAGPHLLRFHCIRWTGGVGAAVGQAVRTSLIMSVLVVLCITLMIYAASRQLSISG